MSPTAFRNGSIPLPVMAPAGQGGEGLVFWDRGDFEVTPTGDGLRMLIQGNKASPSFNPGLRGGGLEGSQGPLVGLDSSDGIPGITWPITTPDVDVVAHLEPADGSGAVLMRDRANVLIGYGAGDTKTITYMVVFQPRTAPDFGGLLGGTLFRLGSTPTGAENDFIVVFRIQDLPPPPGTDAFALWSNDWPDSYPAALYGPATPKATYDDDLLLLHVEATLATGNTVKAWLSGAAVGTMVPIVLTPSIIPAPVPTHGIQPFATFGTNDQVGPSHYARFYGVKYDEIVQDFILSSDAAALTRTYAYFTNFHPSLALGPV